MPFLLTLWGKAKYYILGGAIGLLGLLALIVYERRKGAHQVREGDRAEIIEAVKDLRKREQAISNSPLNLSERRERLRKQRDELRKLL